MTIIASMNGGPLQGQLLSLSGPFPPAEYLVARPANPRAFMSAATDDTVLATEKGVYRLAATARTADHVEVYYWRGWTRHR